MNNNRKVGKPEILHLLQKSFSTKDWEYLLQNITFQVLLSDRNETLDDFESLVEKGTLLLHQRHDLKGQRGEFDTTQMIRK